MIYLIGGAPRCGKTIVAKQLAKKLGTAWISSDAIESVVAEYTPRADWARLFPKSIIRSKTKQSNDLMYAKYSTKEITDAYIKQAKTSWCAVEVMVRCAIQEEHDLIIEGHQIHPVLMARLIKKYKMVKGIIIVRTDLARIISGALKNKAKSDWFIKKTEKPETYKKIAQMIRAYSNILIVESKKYRFKVINTEIDFNNQVKTAVSYLK